MLKSHILCNPYHNKVTIGDCKSFISTVASKCSIYSEPIMYVYIVKRHTVSVKLSGKTNISATVCGDSRNMQTYLLHDACLREQNGQKIVA